MNKRLLMLFFIIMFFAGCAGFFYKTPYSTFDHEKHVEVLFEKKKDCFYCHQLPDIKDIKELKEKKKGIDPEIAIEGKCHSCHKEPETKVANAPGDCGACHQNMKLMKPNDHINEWENLHSIAGKLDKKKCDSCHSEWYCENCHTKRYTVEYNRHPRNYRVYHSVEAMIDPGSCGTCHRTYFCIDCHRKK
jgi:hypothetical protein